MRCPTFKRPSASSPQSRVRVADPFGMTSFCILNKVKLVLTLQQQKQQSTPPFANDAGKKVMTYCCISFYLYLGTKGRKTFLPSPILPAMFLPVMFLPKSYLQIQDSAIKRHETEDGSFWALKTVPPYKCASS